MKSNKHSQSIPAAKLEQAKAKIEEAADLLKPYIIALTPSERMEIPKMGPKTLNFVEKAHEYAHENTSLVPNYLDIGEFDTDFADAHGLWTLHSRLMQLQEGISDTQMTAGSEAFQAALVFYNSAKLAASQGIAGAQAVKPAMAAGQRVNQAAACLGIVNIPRSQGKHHELYFNIFVVNRNTTEKALDILNKYGYSYYDSLIIAVALEANCVILYSEDMQHGQIIESSLKIINPFAD